MFSHAEMSFVSENASRKMAIKNMGRSVSENKLLKKARLDDSESKGGLKLCP